MMAVTMRMIMVVMVMMIAIAMMMRVATMTMVVMSVIVVMVTMIVTMVLRLLLLRLLMMRRRLVMLAQQVEAVVVAVRRAHDRVHVELCRLRIGQEHAGVVIELDERHRALDAVVERAVLAGAADPAEVRVAHVAFEFGEPRLHRTLR